MVSLTKTSLPPQASSADASVASVVNPNARRGAGNRWLWWAERLQWVVIPVLVFTAVEWATRLAYPPQWYAAQQRAAAVHRIDFVFTGSSRVAAAIDTATFEQAAGE